MKEKIKRGLFLFMLLVLFLPLVQQSFHLFDGIKLYGKFDQAPDIDFSIGKWWSGTYWDWKSKYVNDAVGLRPVMIKTNNQVNFSLFGKIPLSIPPPKDDYLFYYSFIWAYSGRDYLGMHRIITSAEKLKAVQDTMKKAGKSLILVCAPGKAFFYPEYLQSIYQNPAKKPTNYAIYTKVADSLGINMIDFNAWFLAIKGKTKDLLFTRSGIHWSTYGAMLAADSLVNYMENLRHIKMRHPVWANVEHTNTAKYADDDIVKCCNFFFPYTKEVYSYPDISYPLQNYMVRPKTVYIGDSFTEMWIFEHFMDKVNVDWKFWYYFREIWDVYDQDESARKRTLAGDEWLGDINSADYVVLVYTASNFSNVGSGFIEKAYDHYFPASPILD